MQSNATAPGESLLRLPAVMARTGLSRTAIYDLVKRRELCPPVKLGPRASAWPSSEIDAFVAKKIAAARPGGGTP